MPASGESEPRTLAELRAEIDRIDAAMHALLIERSSVIDALIKVKGTGLPGAAFRPAREADMMRRLVKRHRGALPLTTAEHIWRVIIATFTHMQAAYGVVADRSGGAAIADLARFQFGFDVELGLLPDAEAVIARVAETKTDLGLVALGETSGRNAWWRGLAGAGRPQVMAGLPFIRVAGGSGLSALVISPPLAEPTRPDIHILAARTAAPEAASRALFGEGLLATAEANGGRELLIAVAAAEMSGLAERCAARGVVLNDIAEVGGMARGVAVDGPTGLLYQSANS